ncbi:MAG: hypothetical protein HY549_11630 [Elusimicrobia bacterium]|nr:hypothetical protein [Elusimicrobiota bacterium]
MIDKAMKTGQVHELPTPIARQLGFEALAKLSGFEVERSVVNNNVYRSFDVVMMSSRPLSLLWYTDFESTDSVESYYYRASLSGKIEKILHISGKLDHAGQALKGSGQAVSEDINSAEMKARFRKEVEFWLRRKRGKGGAARR